MGQLDAGEGECGQQIVMEHCALADDETADHVIDRCQLGRRAQAVRVDADRVDRDLLAQSCDPDLEELIEVRREDGDELDPLEHRECRVLRDREHPLVELQPRELTVQVAGILRVPGKDVQRVIAPSGGRRRPRGVALIGRHGLVPLLRAAGCVPPASRERPHHPLLLAGVGPSPGRRPSGPTIVAAPDARSLV